MRTTRFGAGVLALGLIAGAAAAQDVIGAGADGLDVQLLGDVDPALRKAQAIVNNDIITDTDVEQRLNLVVAANGGNVDPEEKTRLRAQVVRNLIDEKLQIQEAAAKDIKVSEAEVDAAYNRVAGNFKRTPTGFADFLHQSGSSPASIKSQIRGELSWSRLLRRKVEPLVNVGDEEVNAVMARMTATKGSDELNLRKIFLPATAETQDQVMKEAAIYVGEIRAGSSFTVYARQVSQDASRNEGGAIGWVSPSQLSDVVAPVVAALKPGEVSEPFAVPGGIEIWAVEGKRQALAGDPGEAVLSLKQLSISFTPGMTDAAGQAMVNNFQKSTQAMGGCARAEIVAKELGAEVAANDSMKLKALPPALQNIMGQLKIGQATPPFGSAKDGLRVLVLCDRDDSATQAKIPTFDEIYAQMNDERVNRQAQKLLRNLRRDAIIDYR